MKLLYYSILLLLSITRLNAMEVDLTDEDSEASEEQQEKSLAALSRAAAKTSREKRKKSHSLIRELTPQERELLKAGNYKALVESINQNNLSNRQGSVQSKTNMLSKIKVIDTLTSEDHDPSLSLDVPPGHGALCFYKQAYHFEPNDRVTIHQHALIITSDNYLLTQGLTDQTYIHKRTPYIKSINSFSEGDIKLFVCMLIANNLNEERYVATKEMFDLISKQTHPCRLYCCDLNTIKKSNKLKITVKLHENLDEYASYCALYNGKKLYHCESLSSQLAEKMSSVML